MYPVALADKIRHLNIWRQRTPEPSFDHYFLVDVGFRLCDSEKKAREGNGLTVENNRRG